MKHKILISTIAASLLMFSGCGSSDDDTSSTSGVSGAVADGYIKGANVFLDTNCNGVKDSGEISTTTDENGKYTLNISTDLNISGACIVSQGGYDIERGIEIKTNLVAPALKDANVTPLTTMAYTYAEDNNISYQEATNELATKLGIAPSDFTADPEQKTEIKAITTQIQSAIDLIVEANNSVEPKELYKNVALNIKNATDVNLSEALTENMPISDTLKKAVIVTVDKVKEMVENDDFSDFVTINDTLVDAVTSDKNITDLAAYVDYVAQTANIDATTAKEKINSLSADLNTLETDAKSKVATVEDVKNMVSKIRETVYEIVDPNIDNQEENTSTLVGSIIDNANNALKPSIDDINTKLESISTDIDASLKAFDTEIETDFNSTITALDGRLNAIAEVLDRYEENETFSDIDTSYGDKLSHTYSIDDNGVVTDTYTINNQSVTVVYPTQTNSINDVGVSTNGEIVLEGDNYSLNITALSFKDSKLSVISNGKIAGTNGAVMAGDIKVGVSIDEDSFNAGYVLNSLNNIDIELNGSIQTSTNKTLDGTFVFTDNKLSLNGNYKDSSNNIELNGDVVINSTNTEWKKYIDEDEAKLEDEQEQLPLIEVNNKLITGFTVNWDRNTDNTQDVNLTAFDGTIYECNVIDFWPSLEGLQCQNDPVISEKEYSELKGKILQITANGKTFIANDIWTDWDNISNNLTQVSLKIDSNADYEIYENNGVAFLNEGNGVEEQITSISYTTLEPTSAEVLLGDVKVNATVTKDDTKAVLNLAIVKNSDTSVDYYIDDLSLTSNNVTLTAPNLLKVTAENEKVTQAQLNEFNATVTDKNDNKVKLENVYANYTNDSTEETTEFYGKVSYMDVVISGYVKDIEQINNDAYSTQVYLEIDRMGYEPFTVTMDADETDAGVENLNMLINKGTYQIGYKESSQSADTYKDIQLFDGFGVMSNFKITYDENGKLNDIGDINITNSNGDVLGTIKTDNNWEIDYSDNTTETLY